MGKYLGATGLAYFWGKIKSTFIQKSQTAGLLKNDGTIDTNAYITAMTAPVTSVNGLTGDVTISGSGTQVQSDWNQSDNTAVDYIKNKPNVIGATFTYDSVNEDILISPSSMASISNENLTII